MKSVQLQCSANDTKNSLNMNRNKKTTTRTSTTTKLKAAATKPTSTTLRPGRRNNHDSHNENIANKNRVPTTNVSKLPAVFKSLLYSRLQMTSTLDGVTWWRGSILNHLRKWWVTIPANAILITFQPSSTRAPSFWSSNKLASTRFSHTRLF